MAKKTYKITIGELVNRLLPALKSASLLTYKGAPMSFLFSMAENRIECEERYKAYVSTHEKILKEHSVTDNNGEPVTEEVNGQMGYKLKNAIAFEDAIKELEQTQLEVKLHPLDKDHFSKCKDLSPDLIAGLMVLLKK